jgi:tetratricopeptide (TPR) repeat protein
MSDHQSQSLGAIFGNAVGQFQAGCWDEGASLCQGILAGRTDHVDARHLLALCLSKLQRHDEAVSAIDHACRLNPRDPVLQTNAGEVYRLAGRLEEAVARYEESIRLAPQFPEAHFNLGNVRKTLDRNDEAVACYQRAVSLRPGYAEAQYNLGNALLEEGRVKAAVVEYEGALAARPDWADVHLNFGNALLELGRVDDAIGHYQRCAALNPDLGADASLASCYVKAGRPAQARDAYKRVFDRNPDRWWLGLRMAALCPPVAPSRAFIHDFQGALAQTVAEYAQRDLSLPTEDLHS